MDRFFKAVQMLGTMILALLVVFVQTPAQEAPSLYTGKSLDADSLKAGIEALERHVLENSQQAEAYHQLAQLYLAQNTVNSRQKAVRAVKEAISLRPENPAFRVTLASVLRAQSKVSNALETAEEACRMDSTYAEAFFLAGRIRAEEMLANWDKVRVQFQDVRKWNVFGFPSTTEGYLPKEGGVTHKSSSGYAASTPSPAIEMVQPTSWRDFAESDAGKAVHHLMRAIALDPDFWPACTWLGLVSIELGRPQDLVALATKYLERHPDHKDAHLFLGLANALLGDFDTAYAEYQKALSRMNEAESKMMTSADLLYSKQDLKALKKGNENEQEAYERAFWAGRDPLLLTPYNERVLEHWGRMAYANLRFGDPEKGIAGWQTDAGKALIRFGKAPHSESRGVQGNFAFDAQYKVDPDIPAEAQPFWVMPPPSPNPGLKVWSYETFDLNFSNMSGKYNGWELASESKQALVAEPERYVDPYQSVKYTLPVQIVSFKSETGVDLEIAYALPKERLTLKQTDDIYAADLERGVFLLNEAQQPLIKEIDHPKAFKEIWQDSVKAQFLLPTSIDLQVEPGKYHFALEVKDRKSGDIGEFRLAMNVRSFSETLDMSGILLASRVEPLTEFPQSRQDFNIVPNPLLTYEPTELVAVYFEVYGLTRDVFGQARYRTELSVGRVKDQGKKKSNKMAWQIHEAYEANINASTESRYMEIDINKLEPGEYNLKLSITDLSSWQTISREKRFTIYPETIPEQPATK